MTRRLLLPLLPLLLLAAPLAERADARPGQWAPAATATIHPGVQTITAGGQCTANFVFTDGTEVYLGQAAHCSGTGGASDLDGCRSGTRPPGIPVQIQGASRPGELVYSSWHTMRAVGERDPLVCMFNDFALVRIHPEDRHRVNPSVPAFGGPTGLGPATAIGDQVLTYGSSRLRLGLTVLSPKIGISLGAHGGGWHQFVFTVTPGIPGDSGSGILDARGRAVGTLSTLALAPLPASNGVATLARELAYARAHTDLDPVLAPGTEAFVGAPGLLEGLEALFADLARLVDGLDRLVGEPGR